MGWLVYEFALGDESRTGVITDWLEKNKVQKEARVKLDFKLDLLRKHGPSCPVEVLSPGPIDGGHIDKKIKSRFGAEVFKNA